MKIDSIASTRCLGRIVKLSENAGEYVVHASACPVGVQALAASVHPSSNSLRVTQYHYAADGGLSRLVVSNPDTGDQVTTWQYGTSIATDGVARTDLLKTKIYPLDVNAIGQFIRQTTYSYDCPSLRSRPAESLRMEHAAIAAKQCQGRVVTSKDANGTEHAYVLDKLDRITQDRVTALGTGIDGAVRRIAVEYTDRGLLGKVTSHNNATVGAGVIVNQVALSYMACLQTLVTTIMQIRHLVLAIPLAYVASSSFAQSNNDQPPSPDELPKISTVKQDLDFHSAAIEEAKAFVRNQRKADLLPGLKSTDQIADGGWFSLELAMFIKNRSGLLNTVFHITKANSSDKCVYSYSLGRVGPTSEWKILHAWRTHPKGQREMLPLSATEATRLMAERGSRNSPESQPSTGSLPPAPPLVNDKGFKTLHPEFEHVRKIAEVMHSENKLPGISKEEEAISFINSRSFHPELALRRPIYFVPLSFITENEDGWYQYVFIAEASEQEWRLSTAWHMSKKGEWKCLLDDPATLAASEAVAMVNGNAILESELKKKLQLSEPPDLTNHESNSANTKGITAVKRNQALNELITTELIVQDFKKRKGVIQEEILDQDQNEMINGIFKGDKNAFLREVYRLGDNLTQFRIIRERKIIETYMKNFIRKSQGEETPSDNKSENSTDTVEKWIESLRANAKIEIYDLEVKP